MNAIAARDQIYRIGKTERKRAEMRMRREHRRRQRRQWAAQPADWLAAREPGSGPSVWQREMRRSRSNPVEFLR
jgi:hypothetical protein